MTRTKKYEELSATEKIQVDYDLNIDTSLAVPVFKQEDDLIDTINKMMSFLSTVVTSHFLTTNNQLRNSSNPRQQATIHDGRVTVQLVQGRQSLFAAGEGHMERQCPKPKRKRNAIWFRDKVLLVEAQGYGKVLNEEELEFLVDPRVTEGPVTETVIHIMQLIKQMIWMHMILTVTTSLKPRQFLRPICLATDQMFSPRPMLYDGSVIAKETNMISIADSEDTLMLEEESRSKILLKQRDLMRPIGRIFALVGNTYPLTRITATNKVPLREPIPLEVIAQESVVTEVYTRRPKGPKTNGSNSKHTIAKSMISNKTEPTHLGDLIIQLLHLLLLLSILACPNCFVVFGLRMLKAHDWRLLLAHQFRSQVSQYFQVRNGFVRGLPKLKFEKDHLCLACAMGKSKKQSHKPKSKDTNQEKLYLLHIDLCGHMRVASINGKKYILVIVDDYSWFTWVMFLASKDEAPDFIIKFLKMIQVRLNAPARNIRTDNGTEFVNQTLSSYYDKVFISHETSVPRSPQQNGVVEMRNRLGLQSMTSAISSSGLVSNPIPQQPCNPPPRDDWVRLFQPMFDEYFNPSTIAISQVLVANATRAVDLANSLVSMLIDQDDALSTNSTSQGSSSNVRPIHTPFKSLGRWTKDHPLANVIEDPSRSVSTRKQLQTDAMWCYFDAFLTLVEPTKFKQEMTEPSWIDAMQEEIHEFM
nr:retrovirus-related Pol polyprotein from transposon TNT 1-94 [Tanacetum cinerariifolium]